MPTKNGRRLGRSALPRAGTVWVCRCAWSRPEGPCACVWSPSGPHLPEKLQTEADQHHGDAELEQLADARRNLRPQGDHQNCHGKKRRGVPEPPERADQGRSDEAPSLTHDGRDRGEMINVERVAKAENEAEAENSKWGRRHGQEPSLSFHAQVRRIPTCDSDCATMARPAARMTSALPIGARRASLPSSDRRPKSSRE